MIDSPCNDICTIDSKSGLCVGCGRTPSEITNWIHYSDNQKKIILNCLKKRRNNIDNIHDNMLDNRIMNNLFNVTKKQIFPVGLILITFIFHKISSRINFKNLFIYGFAGSLIFFIISNFGVWILGSPGVDNLPYDKNLNGLIECYILAIPFFGNTFLSTVIFSYPAIFIYRSLATRSSAR